LGARGPRPAGGPGGPPGAPSGSLPHCAARWRSGAGPIRPAGPHSGPSGSGPLAAAPLLRLPTLRKSAPPPAALGAKKRALFTRAIMRLVIHNTADEVAHHIARYIQQRILAFKPTPEKPFVLGLPTGSSPVHV
jgi:hypothetical protein